MSGGGAARTRGARRSALAAAGGALVGLTVWAGLPAASARESEGAPAALGSYVLGAQAAGVQLLVGDRIDGTVPDAATTFETGAIGYGRAAIAWPGALVANAGDLVILASAGQIPPEMEPTFRLLNDPVRAEARTPAGPAESTFDQVPGVTMRSSADPTGAAARSAVQGTDAPGVATFASATATSASRLDDAGRMAVAEATSTVTDLHLAGGLIEIDSVVSRAVARSDGVTGSGEGYTTVNGVTVAGQPATIDEGGLRLGGGDASPVNDAANELAAEALTDAGVRVVVSAPVVDADGPGSRVSAGSVLIAVGKGAQRFAVVLGGASTRATAAPAFDVDLPLPVPALADAAASPRPGPGRPALPTTASASPAPPPGAAPAPAASTPATVPVLALLGQANPVWFVVVGALVAAAAAAALRRLATGLLVLPTTTCTATGGKP